MEFDDDECELIDDIVIQKYNSEDIDKFIAEIKNMCKEDCDVILLIDSIGN